MPRIRTIKPEFWNDEKIGQESESIQLTYVGLWSFSDDYGVVRANPCWLKSQIYPYKDKLKLTDFTSWLMRLAELEAIIPFSYRGEHYYCIRTFRRHQYIEKLSKTRNCPEEDLVQLMKNKGFYLSENKEFVKEGNSRGVVGELSPLEKEEEKEKEGDVGKEAGASLFDLSALYKAQVKDISSLTVFIQTYKPDFITPYVDLWNAFAKERGRSQVRSITDDRKKMFKVRIKEPAFDFPEILEKAKESEFLLTSSWFGFDWIFESQMNYVKILEGNYGNGGKPRYEPVPSAFAAPTVNDKIKSKLKAATNQPA